MTIFDPGSNDTTDLSDMVCNLAHLPARAAAVSFKEFLSRAAERIGRADGITVCERIHDRLGEVWQVTWEDCPWYQWAITGGAFLNGPYAGYASMRNRANYTKQQQLLGPFFHDTGERWYLEAANSYSVLFTPNR